MIHREGDELNFMAFPILAAISRKPMTSRELQHTLLISKAQMNKRLRQLKDQNLIVKRDDKKWIPLVVLRMEAPPTPTAYPEEKVPPGAPTGPVIAASKEFHTVPRIDGPPVVGKKMGPKPKAKESAMAVKVATKFNVPASLQGHEVSISTASSCGCGRTTIMRYGPTVVCAVCARGS